MSNQKSNPNIVLVLKLSLLFMLPFLFGFTNPPEITVQKPLPATTKTIKADGTGDYMTFEEADTAASGLTSPVKFVVYPGTYTYFTWNSSGTEDNEIVIEASGTGDVIVENDADNSIVIRASYLIIDGGENNEIIFDGSAKINPYCFQLDDFPAGTTHHVSLWRCVFRNGGAENSASGTFNVGVEGDDIKIYNCIIEGGYSGGLYGVDGDRHEIKNNIVRNNGGSGLQYNPHVDDSSCDDIIISGNAVYNNGFNHERSGIIAMSSGNELYDIEIYNNVLWDNYIGIKKDDEVNTVSQTLGIYNNTVYNSTFVGIYIKSGGTTILKNNISWSNSDNVDAGTTKSNNILNSDGIDPNFISVDDTNDSFLKLSSASTDAIDQGADTGLTDDYFGNFRPQNSGYDIGAHEYTVEPPQSLTITNFEYADPNYNVSLEWDASTQEGFDHYVLYWKTSSGGDYSSGDSQDMGTDTTAGPLSFPADSEPDGTNDVYHFVVTAVDENGRESEYSNEMATLRIANIDSSTDDGAYKEGDLINVTLNFSESVTLAGGNLVLSLDSGGTAEITPFFNGTSASGSYTVVDGESSSDLSVSSVALADGVVTLQNSDGIDVPLTVPPDDNLADNKDIIVDTTPSASNVTSAPAYGSTTLSIQWTASDATAGVDSTELWVKVGEGDWGNSGLDAQTGKTGTFSYSPAVDTGTIYFATRSIDNAGNQEAEPSSDGDASTVIEKVAPSSQASAPDMANGTISIDWTASDATSGLASTKLWVKAGSGGTWGDSGLDDQTGTSGTFYYTPTSGDNTYYFGTQATDNAGNTEATPSGSGDDNTLYDTDPPDSPVISTNSGEDYETEENSVTITGTTSSDTVAIYVNGSTEGVSYAAGATTWSYTGTLAEGENTLEITAADSAGNISNAGTITITYGSNNNDPDQPVLSSPWDGQTSVALTPELTVDPFSDPDSGDTHTKTRWQISTDADFASLVLDVTSRSYLVSITVPDFVLDVDTTYYWRVKVYDDQGAASEWSETFSFDTISADLSDDKNANGVPDDQEVADSTIDLDGDGVPDIDEDPINYKSVNTIVGNGQIGVSSSTNVTSIEAIRSIDPATMTDTSGMPETMPFGLISFKLNVESPGDTAEVNIYLSEAAPSNAAWYKYSASNGWQDFSANAAFSADGKSVTLVLVDGSDGDSDGVANGVIIDPSGPAESVTMENLDADSDSDAPCFLDTMMSDYK